MSEISSPESFGINDMLEVLVYIKSSFEDSGIDELDYIDDIVEDLQYNHNIDINTAWALVNHIYNFYYDSDHHVTDTGDQHYNVHGVAGPNYKANQYIRLMNDAKQIIQEGAHGSGRQGHKKWMNEITKGIDTKSDADMTRDELLCFPLDELKMSTDDFYDPLIN